MRNLFFPKLASRFIGRLNFPQKFSIIFLIIIIIVAFSMYLVFSEMNDEINALIKEKNSIEYLKLTANLLNNLQKYRLNTQIYKHGEASALREIHYTQIKTDHLINQIELLDKVNHIAYTNDETWQNLKQSWSKTKGNFHNLNAEESYRVHTDLMADVLSYVLYIYNDSKLFLDSNYEVYKLSQVEYNVLLASEKLGQIRGLGISVVKEHTLTQEEYSNLFALTNQVLSIYDVINKGLYQFDESHTNMKLKEEINLLKEETVNLSELFSERINPDKELDTAAFLNEEHFCNEMTRIIEINYLFYNKGLNEIENTILTNLNNKIFYKLIIISSIGIILVSIHTILSAFYHYITSAVLNLKNAAEKITNGDLSTRIRIEADDELAQIGSAFNEMGAALEELVYSYQNAQEDLRKQNEKYQLATDAANSAIYDYNVINNQVEWTKGITTFFGYHLDKLEPTYEWWFNKVHPEDQINFVDYITRVNESQDVFSVEYRFRHAKGFFLNVWEKGLILRDSEGLIIRRVGSITDITEQKLAEERINQLVNYNSLTLFPNKNLLIQKINQLISSSNKVDNKFAVLYLNIDRFKYINDSLGYDTGDRVIKQMAYRLSESIEEAFISHLGGDKFVVLLTAVDSERDVTKGAELILKEINKPFTIKNNDIFITLSIGISIYPLDGRNAETLIKNAEIAMYWSKNQTGNKYHFYAVLMDQTVTERLELENELRKALQNKEMYLCYQPKVNINTGKLSGFEALLRWKHPEIGLVPPDKFIPIAEEIGLIKDIGEWVLKEAISQNKAWQEKYPPLTVAVNLSAMQFYQEDLAETIAKMLNDAGLSPEFLELELTESTLQNFNRTTEILTKLKNMGIKIAVDDFGTGYSSLNYLVSFPIDSLKIDKSFISNIVNNKEKTIVNTIISLAHNLNLKVVAEGVETEDQLGILKQLECEEVQGYYFSKPLMADEVENKFMVNNSL